MADYNIRLSELHRRVATRALGVKATIDELGWIHCEHPELGEFDIVLREYNPEFAQIVWPFFNEDGMPRDLLLDVCNTVNITEDAFLTVSEPPYTYVRARITLLLAPPGVMPDESFMLPVIHHAVTKLVSSANAFGAELQKRADEMS